MGGVRNLPDENIYEDIILKRAEEYFNSKNLTIDRKDDNPSYDEKKNAYYFNFSHGNYAERFTARIYIKPKNYKFKNKNNENKNFTNENYKKLIMDSVKNNNKEILSIKESEDDNSIHSIYYEKDGFWGTKKAYYYYYFDVDVTTKSGTKTTKLLFDLDPKRINLPEDFKITKQEYYNQKLDCEHINLILEKIKSENEILFRKGELSLKKNEIKFDFDKKKYYFEVRYRDNQYYYDQKYYLDVEDDYRKKIDLSEHDEYTPLYYNKIFINPDKYDSYKKFGILYFDYLFYNDSEFFHNIYNVIPPKRSYDDFKDIEDYMKFTPYKLKDFYAFNQQDDENGNRYWILTFTNDRKYIFKLVPLTLPEAIQLDNVESERTVTSEDKDRIETILRFYLQNYFKDFKTDEKITVDESGKASLKVTVYTKSKKLPSKEITIRVNKLDDETFDLLDYRHYKNSYVYDSCDNCVTVKPGKPSPADPPNVEDEPYEPDYDTCEPLEEFEEVPKLPKVPDENDEIKDPNNGCNNGCDQPDPVSPPDPGPPPVFPPDPISPEEPNDPKQDPKVTPSDLPKPKPENPVTPSDLPKPKPNNPNTHTPKESTPRIPNEVVGKIPNEVVEKTPITIISNEKKQSVNGESREIENTTGLPNIERKEIKTGDNLFNIIYLIGTFGIFAYFISLLKNKYKHKLN